MQRESGGCKLGSGSLMPSFKLPGCDGNSYDQNYFKGAKASLVVFTCNHCPYVKGSDAELIRIHIENSENGLKTLVISANDSVKYPEDGFEQMKIKAKTLPFPYLFDESQEVARSFDAACTPECYLFDAFGRLAYHGVVKLNPKDPASRESIPLEVAVHQLLTGEPVIPEFVNPIGCSIKWK